ncbi:MAG: NIPSNAP family protein [Mucilaginibacter sp.]
MSFKNYMRRMAALLLVISAFCASSNARAAGNYYYQIKLYRFKTDAQMARVEHYLQYAYIPAMHKLGVKSVGVFKPVDLDTADRKLYVFTPFRTWDELENAAGKLLKDDQYLADGKDYLDAVYNDVPYTRIETMVLKAFPDMPGYALPNLTGNKADRVYELRSYESPTEKYHISKLKMFNEGGEITLFKRLNFNAVFYGAVIAGSHMPNLMYMTTFNNKQDRDEHWKAFSSSPEWKALTAQEQYLHNVSRNDDQFLRPTDYSDF